MNTRRQIIAAVALLLPACSDSAVSVEPTTGALAVTFVTTGSLPDPDGYMFSLDGATDIAVAVDGSSTQTGLAPGNHIVMVSGLASNCTISGDNPRTAAVTAGDTAGVIFAVTCPPPPCGVQLAAYVAAHHNWWLGVMSDRPKLALGCVRWSPESVGL